MDCNANRDGRRLTCSDLQFFLSSFSFTNIYVKPLSQFFQNYSLPACLPVYYIQPQCVQQMLSIVLLLCLLSFMSWLSRFAIVSDVSSLPQCSYTHPKTIDLCCSLCPINCSISWSPSLLLNQCLLMDNHESQWGVNSFLLNLDFSWQWALVVKGWQLHFSLNYIVSLSVDKRHKQCNVIGGRNILGWLS